MLLTGVSAIPAAAQLLYTTIFETVEGTTEAVAPNVKAPIADLSTIVNREATTDASGNYMVKKSPENPGWDLNLGDRATFGGTR